MSDKTKIDFELKKNFLKITALSLASFNIYHEQFNRPNSN